VLTVKEEFGFGGLASARLQYPKLEVFVDLRAHKRRGIKMQRQIER
jgi:GTP cyclohydrolase FolE2